MPSPLGDWIARHDSPDNPLVPAATVVLIRDGSSGLETLMMQRNSQLSFAEGMWVFPGGRIDPDDHPDDGHDIDRAAVAAAVREAREEADLEIDPVTLRYFSHWIPPVQAPKRFSTWFFVAPAPEGEVTVDQGEITDHAWWHPADALERAADRRIEIMVPTWMSLHDLADYRSVAEALADLDAREPRAFATRIVQTPRGPAATWEDDIAHNTGRHDSAGPRHRLVMTEGGWRLERSEG